MCIPLTVARQRLGKHVPAAKEKLLQASFSMRSVRYRRKVRDWFLELLLTRIGFEL
jgi:hypothetical protein